MKQIILVLVLMLVCLFSYGQTTIKRDSAGNFYEVRRTFESAADFATYKKLEPTVLTYTDKTGDVWPVWSKAGKWYWIKPGNPGQYSAREIKTGK